jgi:hypothetical protein
MAEMGEGRKTMTPTLSGRWQTRLVLMWTVGLVVTLLLMLVLILSGTLPANPLNLGFWKLIVLLFYVTLVGLVLDPLYIFIQGFHWDRDWPLAYQFLAGLAEGIIVLVLFASGLLPGAPYGPSDGWIFALHYLLVWQITFWWLFGPMRVVFPRWRFRGGQFF